MDKGLLEAQILGGFQSILGVPYAAYSREFRDLIHRTVQEKPFVASSLRSLLEGSSGHPVPLRSVPAPYQNRFKQFLAVCDFVETLDQVSLEDIQIKEKPLDTKSKLVKKK